MHFSSKSSIDINAMLLFYVANSLENTEFCMILLISTMISKMKAVEKPVETVNNLSQNVRNTRTLRKLDMLQNGKNRTFKRLKTCNML